MKHDRDPDATIDLTAGRAAGPTGDRVALPARYEDLGLIAAGGFGEVRRVRDRHLHSLFAMKILKADRATPEVKRRFFAEARITAWLNHPGIVAVQDVGELDDGRVWYTMQEVRGRTLSAVIRAQRASDPEWTLRRVVDALMRASQAVASAHAVGVVHRDLKPDNLMIGPFGEVRVMDWGLARRLGTPDELAGDASFTHAGTVAGAVMGTPAYMPPEQARGEIDAVGPWSDVYALGATLYEVLTGAPPFPGPGKQAWLAVLAGGPPPLSGQGPEELEQLCEMAMARHPDERPPEAGFFAHELQRWLDGEAARARALTAIARADALRPRVAALRREAASADQEARDALASIPTWAPEVEKQPAWALARRAEEAGIEADLLEVAYENQLRVALDTHRDLPEGVTRLADLYRDQMLAAEAVGDTRGARRAEARLRATGRHVAWLDREAEVSLDTDPPGTPVFAERWLQDGPRWGLGPRVALGVTPLAGATLPPGSWRLTLQGPSGPTLLPILVERGEPWRAVRPGTGPWTLRLPRPGELGPDDVFVPGGWTRVGGDPSANDPEPARALWVDDFVIRRHPVTIAEYVAFLNALVDAGQGALAEALQPREPLSGPSSPPILARDGERFSLDNRRSWGPDVPVSLVPLAGALAFADAAGWRLPTSLEREKAARGCDGRAFPWGNTFDPALANATGSLASTSDLAPVRAFPADESPYGVQGLAGNIRDWCWDGYARLGAEVRDGRAVVPDRPHGVNLSVRGGAYASTAALCRAASRFAAPPEGRYTTLGFRLARTWPSARLL